MFLLCFSLIFGRTTTALTCFHISSTSTCCPKWGSASQKSLAVRLMALVDFSAQSSSTSRKILLLTRPFTVPAHQCTRVPRPSTAGLLLVGSSILLTISTGLVLKGIGTKYQIVYTYKTSFPPAMVALFILLHLRRQVP